ncbi:serine/threonine-protein kinase [Nonomuraea sp. NPDC049309]|uniref:serine/threonine-protein kinase n=1 Tax=Nonomuraea sp. NPDC049309 TaxID=3364350 RepID=UPI00370FC5E4
MTNPLRDGDPRKIGPYELHARLGQGGMGQVFLGRSPGGRLVAVKVVRPDLAEDADFRRRFADEVAAARKVGGAFTAPVIDADTEAGLPWLATAYVPGPSLHQAVADRGPLPLESVAVLGAALAEGLAAVHASGIVHRDLKPANVLLAEDGPRLIDFGIARALDATSTTHTSTVLGTAAFMSPEQARAEKAGPAADVFSLGCVLGFAATGQSPFGTGPVHAVVYRVVHEEPDLSGVPEPLAALITACLAKDPAARPALESLRDDLAALSPRRTEPSAGRLPADLTQVIAQNATRILPAGTTPEKSPAPTRRLPPDTARRPPAKGATRPPTPARRRAEAAERPPEVFDLSTPEGRLRSSVLRPIWGLGCASIVLIVMFLGAAAELDSASDAWAAAWQETMEGGGRFWALALFAFGFFGSGRDGYDVLVLDKEGLTVIDKRWLRWSDRSLFLAWKRLESVRLVPDTNDRGDAQAYRVFVHFKKDWRPEPSWLKEHGLEAKEFGYDVVKLSLAKDTAKQAREPARLRTALERFAGDLYSKRRKRRERRPGPTDDRPA